MDPSVDPQAIDQITSFLKDLGNFGFRLTQTWTLYQAAIMIVLFGAAHVLAWLVTPRVEGWIRSHEGWPKWRLRLFVLLRQRIRLIAFVIALWLVSAVMREVTWPSRSYFIGIVAELITAWLVISIATRMMRNRTFRRLLRWAGWTFITINILGYTDLVANVLDRMAISVGSVHLSLLMVLKAVVILVALFIAVRIMNAAASRRIETIEDISPSMKVLSVKAVQLASYSIAFVIGLQSVGFDMTSLTVLSGAIGLGLGFGLQKVVSNLVSGVILLLDKSIKPGDVITLDDTFGWISSLGARYVSVLTRNGTEFLIPNEDLITNRVVNWSHSSELVRLDIRFGVAYASDPHEVKRIAPAASLKVKRVIASPAPVCHMVGLGDSSIDFILRFWIRDPTNGLTNVRGDVFLALWDALKEAGVEIPFPRRDVTILPGSAELPQDA